MSTEQMDRPFLEAAYVARELLAGPEVAARWDQPSALERMTVGMLACHLARQPVRAAELLVVPATGQPLAEVDEHYRRAAWVTASDLDDPAHDRSGDEAEAADGAGAMLDRLGRALIDVTRLLEDGDAQPVVTIGWQGWSLRRGDFLLTRMVEIVTHTDDLARSVDLATPDFPPTAYRPVLHLLARLAAERHGQAALTSALTRRERMPETISAF